MCISVIMNLKKTFCYSSKAKVCRSQIVLCWEGRDRTTPWCSSCTLLQICWLKFVIWCNCYSQLHRFLPDPFFQCAAIHGLHMSLECQLCHWNGRFWKVSDDYSWSFWDHVCHFCPFWQNTTLHPQQKKDLWNQLCNQHLQHASSTLLYNYSASSSSCLSMIKPSILYPLFWNFNVILFHVEY